MKNHSVKKKITNALLGAAILVALASSCKNKDNGDPLPNGSSGKYLATFEVDNADGETRAFYAKPLSDLNQSGTVSVNNATQFAPATGAFFAQYNKQMYFVDYVMGKSISQCKIDGNGQVSKGATVAFNELAYLSMPTFWKSDVAFMPDNYGLTISIFNPATMLKTGSLDLTQYNRANEVTDFPEAGSTIGVQGVGEVHIRDNTMFVAIFYMNANYQPVVDEAYIAVIDLTKVNTSSVGNTNAIVKLLKDNRCNTLGSCGAGPGGKYFVTDENNDVYALAHNYFGLGETSQNSAIIRIKSGTTEIDPTYFFDLYNVTGQFACGLEYHKNGNFITAVQNPDLLDPNLSFSSFMSPAYNFHIANLYAKTSTAITGFPATQGVRAQKAYFEGDKAYLPYSNKTSQAIYEVDMIKKTAAKKFDTEGIPVLFNLQ